MANTNIDAASAIVISSLPYTLSAKDVLDVISTGGSLWYVYTPNQYEKVIGVLATSPEAEDFLPYAYGYHGTAIDLVEICNEDLGWTWDSWRCIGEFPVNQPGISVSNKLFIKITHNTDYGVDPATLTSATLTLKFATAPRISAPIGSIFIPDFYGAASLAISPTDGSPLRFISVIDFDGNVADFTIISMLPSGISIGERWVPVTGPLLEIFSPQFVSIARITTPFAPAPVTLTPGTNIYKLQVTSDTPKVDLFVHGPGLMP